MRQYNFSYRQDIDGLRALAVIAVVLYHFNKNWLPGGFGYSITGIIHRQGTNFSFSEFYGRRIRRILPAAVFMTAITLMMGSFLLMPADVKALSESAIASVLSAANIYYWLFLDTSYFAASSETVPLLHMWSLGVEEQFYLIWPAMMIIATRLGGIRLLVATSVLVAVASFTIGEYYLGRSPSFAYYMLPSRAGELLIGALLLLWQDSRRVPSPTASNVMGVVGLALVGWSLAFLSETGGFPGLRSLAPAAGTALLIASGVNSLSLVARSLTNPLLRYIGLRSFSVYLWHWPVLAFYRYGYGEPNASGAVACGLIIFALAEFSYRLVETPMRAHSPDWLLTKATPILGFSALIVAAGYVLMQGKGLWPLDSSKVYQRQLNAFDYNTKPASRFAFNCQMFKNDPSLWSESKCLIGDTSKPAEVLLWGDSNAAHYVGYLKAVGEHSGFAIRNISHSSCPPIRGDLNKMVPLSAQESCAAFNDLAFSESKKFATVIVGAAWDAYFRRGGKQQIEAAIAELADDGKQVIIALTVPIFEGLDRTCGAKAIRFPGMNCADNAVYKSSTDTDTNLYLVELAGRYPNVKTFSVRDKICTDGKCAAYQGGELLYYDRGHLSMVGSETIGSNSIKDGTVPKEIVSLKNPVNNKL